MSDPTQPAGDAPEPGYQPPPPPPPPGGYPPAAGGYPPAQGGYGPLPPGYAYQPTSYPPPPPTSGKATAILVLGIVSMVLVCGYGVGLIPAIVALALAPGAKRDLAASNGRLGGEGFIKAGVICSWVTVGLFIAVFLFIIVAIVFGTAASNDFSP